MARRLLDEYAGVYDLTPAIALRLVTSDSGLLLERDNNPVVWQRRGSR